MSWESATNSHTALADSLGPAYLNTGAQGRDLKHQDSSPSLSGSIDINEKGEYVYSEDLPYGGAVRALPKGDGRRSSEPEGKHEAIPLGSNDGHDDEEDPGERRSSLANARRRSSTSQHARGQGGKSKRRICIGLAVLGCLVVAGVVVGVAVGLTRKRHLDGTETGLAGTTQTQTKASQVVQTYTSKGNVFTTTRAVSVVVAPTPTPSGGRTLVVFGASYCDNGHPRPARYSNSLKKPPYFDGRESNGIVWDEYLAQSLGSNGQNASLVNYAYSGAMVDNTLTTGSSVPDTAAQMQSFISDLRSGAVGRPTAGSRTLIMVWVGLNSVIGAWQAATSGGSRSVDSTRAGWYNQNMVLNGASLFRQIEQVEANLTSMSIDHDWLVLPLPPTEILPYARFTSKGNQAYLSLFATLTDAYNADLGTRIASWSHNSTSKMITMDVVGLYDGLMRTPSIAGAQVSDTQNPCVGGGNVCSNPQTHVFWDSIHMTTGLHKWFAGNVLQAVNQLWSS